MDNLPEKSNAGRPSSYNKDDGDAIIELTRTTTWGMKKICLHLGLNYSTANNWLVINQQFSEEYDRAKLQQQDLQYEEILDISDEDLPKNDMAAAARQKLRVETRKWGMARLARNKWGDRVQTENLTPPPKQLTQDQFEDFLKTMIGLGGAKPTPINNGQRNDGFEDAQIVQE